MCKTFIPLYDKILIEKLEEKESKTNSGIILPNDMKKSLSSGKVISVGNGHRTSCGEIKKLLIEPGDIVSYQKYAGTDWNDNQKIIREDDILGKLK